MSELVRSIDMIKRYSISIADGGSVVLDAVDIVLRTSTGCVRSRRFGRPMSCDNCLCRTCIFSCELSYSRRMGEGKNG